MKRLFKYPFLMTVLFFVTVFGLIVLFADPPPEHGMVRSFKMPLEALLKSGKERMTLQELYGGTDFEGDTMCMYYPDKNYPGGLTVSEILLEKFPIMEAKIARANIQQQNPDWMIAVVRADSMTVITGDPRLAYYKDVIAFEWGGAESEKYNPASKGINCINFTDGAFRVMPNVRYGYDNTDGRLVVLTHKDSLDFAARAVLRKQQQERIKQPRKTTQPPPPSAP
jgi:hypothetical protein